MPIQSCSDGGKPGYKWGDGGKCYLYTPGNDQSITSARKKALAQGIAIGDINISKLKEELDKINEVSTSTMGSGIKNPQQGYGKKKKRFLTPEEVDYVVKSLKEWFNEKWVDISRPKPGGGFEECGRSDVSTGKYPKCVPASRAARMTQAEIDSAVRRKRLAESTRRRQDKKPIYVSTEKSETIAVPTNPALYARVKAEAKRKFDVYPSAYANAWLVREYKKRGGGYRNVSKGDYMKKVADDLTEDEAMLAEALAVIAERYGKFNEDGTGIWAGYEPASENDDAEIGVNCKNCVLYEGNGVCKIIAGEVEEMGKCRFAVIPDGLVTMKPEDEMEEDEMEMEDESEEDEETESEESDAMSMLISIIRDILNTRGDIK